MNRPFERRGSDGDCSPPHTDPLFWFDVGDEVTTHYTYEGAEVVPPSLPSLEQVRAQAVERVEHRAEL